eukprot:6186341-Pleurochrysis_carterae.AAC.1
MRAHESHACKSVMHGRSQMGPWRACMNSGEDMCPLSAGCSSRYSAPESRPALSNEAVRSTRRLACCSSRCCWGGTFGSPMMWFRSRTGGGPPSGTSPAKNRLTENVEQGGEATMAAYAPAEQRSSRRAYTESKRRTRCRRVVGTGPRIAGARYEMREPVSESRASEWVPCPSLVRLPGGWSPPVSCTALAIGVLAAEDVGFQGNTFPSKYTSEAPGVVRLRPRSRIPCAVLLDAPSGGHGDATAASAASGTSH